MDGSKFDPQFTENSSWTQRCEYWTNSPIKYPHSSRGWRRSNKPLILSGHGISLRVHQGTLLVRNGFTHYPQTAEQHRYFPADREKPPRIIVVDGDGIITLDVLSWLAVNEIPLIRLDWRGNVNSFLSKSHGPDHKLVHEQFRAQSRALVIAISLIVQKLKNSILTLKALPQSPIIRNAIVKIRADVRELLHTPPKSLNALRGIEGRSALLYFSAWQQLPIKWKGLANRPIPRDWNVFGRRTSDKTTKGSNRDASHPVNAMLNYAYAILENHVRMQIISRGYDPTIGYLHAFDKYRAALVFDLMEPLRPVVDLVVMGIVQEHTFQRTDFTIQADGICRLNPQMARYVVSLIDKSLGANTITISI